MNGTRLMIRATGEKHWTEISNYPLMTVLEKFLRAQIEAANIELPKSGDERQVVTDIDLDVLYLKVPISAATAVDAGLPREESSFEPGGDRARQMGQILRDRMAAAVFDATGYSGHSLRAGFATSATRAGVSTFKIRQQTGHASDTMLSRYVREGELFLGNAAGILL